MEHLNCLRQPFQKTRNQAKRQVQTSRQSRTSSQRQRDLLIAKQRREEIEKENEAALRIAKHQEDLELERLQQEQEQLRLRADRLKKEQALSVEELQEENRQKLDEATLTELELRDDLSDSQLNLEETLSKLSVSSKADGTARINDWVKNSPVATEPAPTNARSVTLPLPEQVVPPATTINSVVNPVTGIAHVHTTTAPVASTSNNPPAMQLQNNTFPQPTMAATHLLVNPPVTSTSTTNVTAPPFVPTVMVQSQPLTVPASHVLPNLSAWTFPTATDNAPTSVIPVTTSIQLLPTLPTVVPITIGYPTSTPVIPVTAGGTVYYLSSSSLATVTIPTSARLSNISTVSPSALPFTTSPTIAPPQPSTSGFTVQDLAQLLMSSKEDHLPEWKLAQYSSDP